MKARWAMRRLRVLFPVVALTTFLLAAVLFNEQTPGIPSPFSPNETSFQNQTHFLVFPDSAGENATTATAYYNAIDPGHTKLTFPQWLKNAGFINDVSQWHSTGPQKIACNLPGCDYPAGTYGDNIINTDSHAIVLNAADLGFVRNQFIRCVPSCTAPKPIIYTYLENYPVNPFAASRNGGSGFPILTGYPSKAEAAAAIASALNRPSDPDPANHPALTGCVTANTDTVLGCKISRIADVAFEWAPPASNPTSSTRFGQLYAYVFADGPPATETIAFPNSFTQNCNDPNAKLTNCSPNVAAHALQTFHGGLTVDPIATNNNSYTGVRGDPFPPNLDFIGFKQHPGVCFICHGGKPQNLTSTGAYPNHGNVSEFRFLPLDIRNLLFTSDAGGEQPALPTSTAFTDRTNQELQIKLYNQAVLLTVPTSVENDGTGSTRVAHLREVITGWYTDPGGPLFGRTTQNTDFIPVGWRESVHGGPAPAGSEKLYQEVLSPSCRSCHFNREVSLDFGTAANFMQESDILQYALLPGCSVLRPQDYSPDPQAKYMPLAHLTYQRYWQANPSTGGSTQITLPYPAPGINVSNTADQIASYFAFSNVAGYCATNP